MQGGTDQEGDDSLIQPLVEWGCNRNNQSIIGSAKVMIHDKDFPMFIWAEVCNMVVYV
jgi:hypothetical protein